jgi:drug/metabolite transporter (DMT)-like permease
VTVMLALCAAIAFGASVAFQERAASDVPHVFALRLRLLTRLAQRPVWLLGLAAGTVGFLLQAAALRHGSLIVVQPLMTTALIFALAFVAFWAREPLHRAEWIGVVAVVAGLVGFLISAAPDVDSRAHAAADAWWSSAAIVAVAVGLPALVALRTLGRRRATLLGLAAGISNGYVAVLTKAFAQDLREGVSLVRDWPLWGLLMAAIPAVLLVQSVYQSGKLRISLPIIAVVEPFVASMAGLVLFNEHIQVGSARAVAALASVAIIGMGLWRLARNPRITARAVAERNSIDHGGHGGKFETLIPQPEEEVR